MDIKVLQKDMIAAMKARDKARKESISALIQAVKKAGIDAGCRDDIPEEMVNKVILKELKTVKEQIDSCPADRTDLIEEYQARYDVFNEYAPKLMSAEEVEAELKEKLAESLELLTEKERRVIELYYYEDMTLKEISKILEVSESRISQLHTKALNKMRKKMGVYMNILTE